MARVINSQMLSTHAASAILSRLQDAVESSDHALIADLPEPVLRQCGWSKSKVKALKEFRQRYLSNPRRFEQWSKLGFEELEKEVDECWGVSTWTAEMLAIFYFNNRDVFPEKDLAVNKARANAESRYGKFDPKLGSPHRTLLAMYMWGSYRTDFWSVLEENL